MPAGFDPRWDGHTHTQWCPHGAARPTHEYLDRALELGFERCALTEHCPLPPGFQDPFGRRECAMLVDELPGYLAEAEALREQYAGRLEVRVGLEIDYLGAAQGGWHGPLLDLLGPIWSRLAPDATILSLHFLDDQVVDGTVDRMRALIPPGESVEAVHLRYYATLRSALTASWRWRGQDLRPRRLGHLTLPRKFSRALPLSDPDRVEAAALSVVELAAAEGVELDLNTSGLDKPDCGEIYLSESLARRAIELGVPLVYGSDAHAPEQVGRHLAAAADLVRQAAG